LWVFYFVVFVEAALKEHNVYNPRRQRGNDRQTVFTPTGLFFAKKGKIFSNFPPKRGYFT